MNETLNGYCYVNVPLDFFILDTLFSGIGHYKSAGGAGVGISETKILPVGCFKICHANRQ